MQCHLGLLLNSERRFKLLHKEVKFCKKCKSWKRRPELGPQLVPPPAVG